MVAGIVGCFAIVFAIIAFLDSRWVTSRRLARQRKAFEEALRVESDEALRDMILTSPYEYVPGVFCAAERSIGYRGRPEIMDYDGMFIAVLNELRRRS